MVMEACHLLKHMQPTWLSHIVSQLVQSLALGPALLVLEVQLLRILSHPDRGFDLVLSDYGCQTSCIQNNIQNDCTWSSLMTQAGRGPLSYRGGRASYNLSLILQAFACAQVLQ